VPAPYKVPEKVFEISGTPGKPAFWRVFSFWRAVGFREWPALIRLVLRVEVRFDIGDYPCGPPNCPAYRYLLSHGQARKREYKLFDGDGLDLLVQANGRNGGRIRYVKPDGREGLAALSSYPVIRLFQWEEPGALDSAAALIAFGFAATSLLT